MVFNKIPGVYLDEVVDYELSGVGSKIPVFIGKTGNSGTAAYKVDGTVALKFTSYDELNKETTAGGIGLNNDLNKVLKEFFDEAKLKQPDDIGVPYVYVIDVGADTDRDAWLTAIETGFSKFLDLDRCYAKNYIDVDNGKQLVLFNVHLSAYTTDPSTAVNQIKMLTEDMQAEYDAGNYVIVGGDMNKDLLGDSSEYFGGDRKAILGQKHSQLSSCQIHLK